MTRMQILLLALLASSVSAPLQEQEAKPTPVVVSTCIWKEAPHSAFVDLIRFRDRFYCAFREGSGHVPGEWGSDGTIRVITSADGETWTTVATLDEEGIDLRDPKLSVTPDGRIMLVVGGSVYDGKKLLGRVPRASFSNEEGLLFSRPTPLRIDPAIAGEQDWLWRVTWHEGTAWGVLYQPAAEKEAWGLQLVRSSDGVEWKHVHTFELDGKPNESTARFLEDGRMVVVVRREGDDRLGVVGTAAAPYTDWTLRKLDRRLGGPNLVALPSGRWILGTRQYGEGGQYRTVLVRLDLDGTTTLLCELASGGDTSYPGMVVHEGTLWVAYYSSHEDQTAIYLAPVPLGELGE